MGTLFMELNLIGYQAFHLQVVGFGSNVIVFEVHMSSSVHVDNKIKDILILGRVPRQDLGHTLTAGNMYSLILQWQKRNFV